ncbi:APC family permease [Dactylosporangium sp. NPDC049525]|uniref:APC family permease n=1 Tax=Dactylosporangium sp. NPDC049525 TaxID=3154730 RepID=UPI00343D85AD
MRSAASPHGDVVARTLARNRLGVWSVVFFVMSAVAPLTVQAGLVTTGFAVTGVTAIPQSFLLVGAVLAVFAVGYVAMARYMANAGAFYAYVARGLGRPMGVGAAWVALAAYTALQVALYGAIGVFTKPLLEQWFGVRVAWWVIALAAWSLVAVLGVLRVDVNSKVLAVLMLAEVAVILVFDAVDLLHPAGGTITFDTLAPGDLFDARIGAGLAMAMLGFVGFESAVVFSEEARDPVRTVRLATFVSLGAMALLYAGSSWAMTVGVGSDRIVAAAREQGPEVVFALAAEHLGPLAADIGWTLLCTSVIAALIAFHNLIARYVFALGREQVLPAWLGRTSRSGAPRGGSLLQSLAGLAVIVIYAVAGWDPLVHLFFIVGTGGGYGVLLLVTLTSVAVIVFFVRNRTLDSVWQRRLAPLLAAAALLAVVVLATTQFDTLLGVAPDSPLRWVIPAGYVAVAVLGVGWGLVLKVARPDVYANIGLGAKSATVGLDAAASGAASDTHATAALGRASVEEPTR